MAQTEGSRARQRALLRSSDVAVLLLSATPYKMYTGADEAQGEDHYRDFVRTLRFLERSNGGDSSLDTLLIGYRKALLSAGEHGTEEPLHASRADLEARLRRVMVRTERLASTPDRNGMLVEKQAASVGLRERDVLDFLALQNVGRILEQPRRARILEERARSLLNFMDENYKLKRGLNAAAEEADRRMALARALLSRSSAALEWERVERYAELDAGNGRFRALLDETVGRGAHQLLWVPPSLPYYRPASRAVWRPCRSGVHEATRFLVVALGAAGRGRVSELRGGAPHGRAFRARGRIRPEARKRRARLLRFEVAPTAYTGMPVLALMYPSAYLAKACNPAHLAKTAADGNGVSSVDIHRILGEAESIIEVALTRLRVAPVLDGQEDERWYWAAAATARPSSRARGNKGMVCPTAARGNLGR